jgi:hypothetical protein
MGQYTKRLVQAKNVIKKIIQGINPVDDSKIPSESILNDVNFSRNLVDIYMLLDDLELDPLLNNTNKLNSDFYMTLSQVNQFTYCVPNTFLTQFCQSLEKYADENNCRKIARKKVNEWLISEGIFEFDPIGNKIVSIKGQKFGFTSEVRVGKVKGGSYYVTLLNQEAQKYILTRYVTIK